MLQLVLTALDAPLAEAWKRHCGDFDFVSIEKRSILEVEADALVSPANSFGFMDGGIDLAYSNFFGWQLQAAVQARIQSRFDGELPVGAADLVETGHLSFPWLVVAPTMRVPMALVNSPNPYLAARAAPVLLVNGKFETGPHAGDPISTRIERVAFPGLGTGVGELSADVCARQMRHAICSVLLGSVEFPRSWIQAQEIHYEMTRPSWRPP
ncbi:MAG: macro domain-containing protein [Ahniella sp.]|nr:macro domain-containing protein [Ahniella sp.]